MDSVLNNPFRILGLPVTASERDIAKSVSDLSIFAEMGKSKSYDNDFPFLPDVERTPGAIQEAANRIEQPDGKLFYALFWFWKNNRADDQGFALLKNGEIEKAADLWTKCTVGRNISVENYSTLKNLSVLYLGRSADDSVPHSEKQAFFLKGITFSGNVFSNALFDAYSRMIAGTNYPLDKEKIIRAFADEAIRFAKGYQDKPQRIAAGELLENFRSFPNEIFPYISGKFTDQPIQRIEAEIGKVREKRAEHPDDAIQYGESLYKNTLNDLAYLKSVLSPSDLQHQITADRLANEILQCAIDYFNIRRKQPGAHDPGERALNLLNHAIFIAVGERVRSRIEENLFVMNTYVNAAPQRKLQSEIQLLVDDIADRLNSLPDTQDMLTTAQMLFNHSVYKLLLIKESLGVKDVAYMSLSSAVADRASGLCIKFADQTREYTEAVNVMESIGTLDMLPEIREKYDKNRKLLYHKRETQIFDAIRESSKSSEKEKRCYIGTMVYGDADAPQVLALKKFRDHVLSHYTLGRIFIRFYYKYSPLFVAVFKDSKAVNKGVKIIIDQFISVPDR